MGTYRISYGSKDRRKLTETRYTTKEGAKKRIKFYKIINKSTKLINKKNKWWLSKKKNPRVIFK